jgi:hypothetical protein
MDESEQLGGGLAVVEAYESEHARLGAERPCAARLAVITDRRTAPGGDGWPGRQWVWSLGARSRAG